MEPVNPAKLGPGSTPSLPGAERDDITQTEASAWMGFNSGKAGTCSVQGLPGFALRRLSAPLPNSFQLGSGDSLLWGLGDGGWLFGLPGLGFWFFHQIPIPWATRPSPACLPAPAPQPPCVFSLPALNSIVLMLPGQGQDPSSDLAAVSLQGTQGPLPVGPQPRPTQNPTGCLCCLLAEHMLGGFLGVCCLSVSSYLTSVSALPIWLMVPAFLALCFLSASGLPPGSPLSATSLLGQGSCPLSSHCQEPLTLGGEAVGDSSLWNCLGTSGSLTSGSFLCPGDASGGLKWVVEGSTDVAFASDRGPGPAEKHLPSFLPTGGGHSWGGGGVPEITVL